ncbi:MAG: lipoyl(octanoyl) transferase LipB [Desulfomonile sp.]|nr:lipoyl(octanoyl) transferase LipB [Desulfomonile sp.]
MPIPVDRRLGAVPCLYADLGLVSVEDAERFMNAAAQLRSAGAIPDLLLFLAHPKTVAVGLRDRQTEHPVDLLVPVRRLEDEGIAFARSTRGGGITYHWPGQVVCYPVLALSASERNIPRYMTNLEESCIRVLAQFGVRVTRSRASAAHVGLWWNGRKVVSMGVRISNWITGFGFALNLDGDHTPSCYVRPCGLEGVTLVTVEEVLGTAPSRAWIIGSMRRSLGALLGRTLEPAPETVINTIRALVSQAGTPTRQSGWGT